jgi:hypothetical protein
MKARCVSSWEKASPGTRNKFEHKRLNQALRTQQHLFPSLAGAPVDQRLLLRLLQIAPPCPLTGCTDLSSSPPLLPPAFFSSLSITPTPFLFPSLADATFDQRF